MPRRPRPDEEVEAVKARVLDEALRLIEQTGVEGLTMRRLADCLGVKAVTIYSYYESKDHLYLAVLTRGFRMLLDRCSAAYQVSEDPMTRLREMTRAYLDFGIDNPNFYNLMFTWHVPKYQDYVGTPMEEAALHELLESQKVYLLFIRAVKELAAAVAPLTDEQAREHIIFFWSALHGYVAGINNSLLDYMHPKPLELREMVLENLFRCIRLGMEDAARGKVQ